MKPMLGLCWVTVYDVGPTFSQHWLQVCVCWDICYLISEADITVGSVEDDKYNKLPVYYNKVCVAQTDGVFH